MQTLYIQELIEAVINNDSDTVMSLLEQGANPNAVLGKEGLTPLHFAACHGAMDVIPILLIAGADPSRADTEGITPISIAYVQNNQQILDYFLNYQTTNRTLH